MRGVSEGCGSDEGPRFRYFDHTADVGVEAFGETLAAAFANAAEAVLELMLDRATVPVVCPLPLTLLRRDLGALLVGFLNEVIYIVYGEGFVPKRVVVTSVGPVQGSSPDRRVSAEAGEKAGPGAGSEPFGWVLEAIAEGAPRSETSGVVVHRTEVKAATFHGLAVTGGPARGKPWQLRFILDI